MNNLPCGHPEACLKDGRCQWCRDRDLWRMVESQLRKRLEALIDSSCKSCQEAERQALRQIKRGW